MTIKQKQCLLCFLGYYDRKIDGVWGEGSEQATMNFQNDYGLTVSGLFDEQTESMAVKAVSGEAHPVENTGKDFWEEIRYFKKDEFKCKCGGKHCDGFPVEPDEKLVRLADRVRAHFGAAATVSSGVRCVKHNAFVGGVTNSRHLKGTAMDFCIRGLPSSIVLPYVQAQKEVRYAYAIDGSYVHMDVK
jgi:hypothetical protein